MPLACSGSSARNPNPTWGVTALKAAAAMPRSSKTEHMLGTDLEEVIRTAVATHAADAARSCKRSSMNQSDGTKQLRSNQPHDAISVAERAGATALLVFCLIVSIFGVLVGAGIAPALFFYLDFALLVLAAFSLWKVRRTTSRRICFIRVVSCVALLAGALLALATS